MSEIKQAAETELTAKEFCEEMVNNLKHNVAKDKKRRAEPQPAGETLTTREKFERWATNYGWSIHQIKSKVSGVEAQWDSYQAGLVAATAPVPPQAGDDAERPARRRHLVHEAYASLLRRATEYDEKDWERADKFERHAINAALDLRTAEAENAKLREGCLAAIPFLFEYGAHQNNHCYRGSGDGCYCGLDEAKRRVAEAERLLIGKE